MTFHAKEGGFIPANDLIADIEVDNLEKVELDNKETSRRVLEVEIQEDVHVVKYLHKEGDLVNCGLPLALLCELEEDIEQAKKLEVTVIEF